MDGAGNTRETLSYDMAQGSPTKGNLATKSTAEATLVVAQQPLGNGFIQTTKSDAVTQRVLSQSTFNAAGYLVSKSTKFTDAAGNPQSSSVSLTYDTSRRWTKAVYSGIGCALGKRVERVFDANGRPTTITIKAADIDQSSGDDIVDQYAYDAGGNMVSHTDPCGATSLFEYDVVGNQTKTKVPVSQQGQTVTYAETTYQYNQRGQVTQIMDATSRRTDVQYEAAGPKLGLLRSVTVDPLGANLTTSVDVDSAWGSLASTTSPSGATWLTSTSPLGTLEDVTPPLANYKVEYAYDLAEQLSEVRVRNVDDTGTVDSALPWKSTTFARDAMGRLTGTTQAVDATASVSSSVVHDGSGHVAELIDFDGGRTGIVRDERGLPVQIVRGKGTQLENRTKFEFNEARQMTRHVDALGNAYTTEYDGFGRALRVIDAVGHRTEVAYDIASRPTSISEYDSAGTMLSKREATYDLRGALATEVTHEFVAGGQTVLRTKTYERDLVGRVTKVTDESGSATEFEYEVHGRLARILDSVGNETCNEYDVNGNLVKVTAKQMEGGTLRSYVHEFDYDAMDRIVEHREIDRSNSSHVATTRSTYDSLSNPVSCGGATSENWRTKYDGRNLPVERSKDILSAGGQVVGHATETATYDACGRLASLTDANGGTTQYAYDPLGRCTQATYPGGAVHRFTYDAEDRITTFTDPNGTVVSNTYDVMSRLTARSVVRATGVLGTTAESYAYDAISRIVAASDDDSLVTLNYDSRGGVVADHQFSAPSGGVQKTVSSSYDAVGRLAAYSYSAGASIAYARDGLGRVASIANGTVVEQVNAWTGASRLAQIQRANGVTTTISHDGFGRVSQLIHATTAATLQGFSTARDDSGRLLFEQRSHSGGAGDVYRYDSLERLVTTLRGVVNPPAEVAAPGSQAYIDRVDHVLDALDNRQSAIVTPFGGAPATTTYQSNSRNQYTSVGGVTHVYDANSNLTDDGTQLYAYDYRNQLVEVRSKATGSQIATYTYDAFGRRTSKICGGSMTRYVYSGREIVEEYDASWTLQAYYVIDDGFDARAAMYRLDSGDYDGDGNVTEFLPFYYMQDSRGNVSALTDSGGAIAETYAYDEFGAVTISDRSGGVVAATVVGNAMTYKSRPLDTETGLYDMRARTYNPRLGRFLQPDPAGYIDGMNIVGFVGHDPINYRDPTGLSIYVDCPGKNATDKEKADWEAKVEKLEGQLNKDLHGKKGDKHTDKKFEVDRKTGELKLVYTSKGKEGQKVPADDKTLSAGLKNLMNMMGDETRTTVHLVGNDFRFASKEEVGLPFVQRGADGDVYINVDARDEYSKAFDKANTVARTSHEDPMDSIAGLIHEAREHRGGNEYRRMTAAQHLALQEKNLDSPYDYGHKQAVEDENAYRSGEGLSVRDPTEKGWGKSQNNDPTLELPATLHTAWTDPDGKGWNMDVYHNESGGVPATGVSFPR